MTTPPAVVITIAVTTPACFHSDLYEDVEDWLQEYEQVAQHNQCTNKQRLQTVYITLEGTARLRFENHETSLTIFKDAGMC